MKKIIVLILAVCLLLPGCAGNTGTNENPSNTGSKKVILDEDVESKAAEAVVIAGRKARYETFDVDAYIATNICGNSTFLKYVSPEHDINEVKTYIDDCYKSLKSTISKNAEEWAEFTAAGGSAEFGVDFDLLIQEGHEYYSYYMHRFENDEDTYFLDKNAVEAFATVSVGIEWVVPRKMESEWGESRDQQYDAVLVRIDGSWYTVGL